jgi:CBS domain-containing protein
VGDIMTRNPVFVRQEMPLQKATELMITKRVKRLPVLQDERLIGMLTRFDLLTALSARLTDHNGEASDTDISTSIQTALAREPWAPKSGVRYLVKAGRVQLEGNVFSEEESRALRVLVENTAGVTLVVNLLNISEAALPHGVHAERFF